VDKMNAVKFGKVTTTWLSTLFHLLSTLNKWAAARVLGSCPLRWNKKRREK